MLLARLAHPNRSIDPTRLDAARAVRVWDAVASIEAFCEDQK